MTQPSVEPPKGFKASACSSGIKKSGKPDLALIYAEKPVACAGVFTTNQVVAAPVLLTSPRVGSGLCQAVLVNSGNANACTGEAGLADAKRCSSLLAESLGISEELIAVASTGVIGVPLPMPAFEQHLPQLAASLGADQFDAVATAMMTTDAFPKVSTRTLEVDGRSCRILGLAKGAGMIHPNMATMLGFVMTDAAIAPACLTRMLRAATNLSFNRITVDRDTSTNDMTLLLASGAAGNDEITDDHPDVELFEAALEDLLLDLAKMIVKDGEGATKLVRIQIDGARDDAEALVVARSVATSQLVKTAFFGEDANWGRILAAAGYAEAEVDPSKVRICFDDVQIVADGLGLTGESESLATAVMKQDEFTVTVALGLGTGSAYYYTSDLGYEYVRINADYRT